jgi:hypothetical protein
VLKNSFTEALSFAPGFAMGFLMAGKGYGSKLSHLTKLLRYLKQRKTIVYRIVLF